MSAALTVTRCAKLDVMCAKIMGTEPDYGRDAGSAGDKISSAHFYMIEHEVAAASEALENIATRVTIMDDLRRNDSDVNDATRAFLETVNTLICVYYYPVSKYAKTNGCMHVNDVPITIDIAYALYHMGVETVMRPILTAFAYPTSHTSVGEMLQHMAEKAKEIGHVYAKFPASPIADLMDFIHFVEPKQPPKRQRDCAEEPTQSLSDYVGMLRSLGGR